MMELQLLQKGLELSRRRKKLILLVGAFGVTGYGVYKVYHLPSVAEKRRKFLKLFGALISIAEVVSDSAETIEIVSKDLKEFLQSDSDQIPTSLKQISKIAKSDEFSDSVIRVTQALAVGILRGYKSEMEYYDQSQSGSSYLDRIMDKLLSGAGSGFASVVVGSFARSLVMALYSCAQSSGDSRPNEQMSASGLELDSPSIPGWINAVCSNKCRELIADCIQLFVSTAVAVYLDKTMSINTYDELFSGLTNPKHEMKVRDILVSVCNGALETLVKTSHKVLTSSNPASSPTLTSDQNGDQSVIVKYKDLDPKVPSTEAKSNASFEVDKDGEWLNKVSSTLAVPSNKRFVLDVTGRVTFETVRSFLDFLVWKLLDAFKRSVSGVCDAVAERGIEVMRYVGAKSTVIHTICIALCLHVLDGAKVLIPA